jgi:UTP--glucose-1-phosphate uridylyltransferase
MLEKRFPFGVPSLINCVRLQVDGDVRFGRNITIIGNVHLKAENEPLHIEDNAVIGD